MIDPVQLSLIIGIVTLCVERFFSYLSKIKKSECCGNVIENNV